MPNLCKKIQATRLFSDPQKVDLLAMLEDASSDDKKKLEEGIDTFDKEYARNMEKRREEVEALLATIKESMSEEDQRRNQDAIDEIRMGLDFLASAQ